MQDMSKLTEDELWDIMNADPNSDAAEAAGTEYGKRAQKASLLNAAIMLVEDIKKGDILTAAWACKRIDDLLNDETVLAAYGLKLDTSDIMRPRLVKIEVES